MVMLGCLQKFNSLKKIEESTEGFNGSGMKGYWQVTDAHFDSLRSDRRYVELLRNLNLPEEAIQRQLARR